MTWKVPSRTTSRRAFLALILAVGGLLAMRGPVWTYQLGGSYHYLSDRAKMLIDGLEGVGDGDGQLNDAAAYNALEESKRTTFESIMHALEVQNLLHLVARVTAIWGEISPSPAPRGVPSRPPSGGDQFRISVTLVEGAPEQLANSGYSLKQKGPHVKLSDGEVKGWRDSTTARQSGGHPSMQVSWLKQTPTVGEPTVGEIDIDYIEFGFLAFLGLGHADIRNSDVRADLLGYTSNYEAHVRRYGDGLERWWETR